MTDRLSAALRALRPAQWAKNAVVLAAFVFALGDPEQHAGWALVWKAVAAMLLFCGLSSGIYLFNDLRDIERDRAHPVKRLRPIASGALPVPAAAILSAALLAGGLAGAAALAWPFFQVGAVYVAMHAVYSMGLKRIALVDVIVIAAGFVLRALGGGRAIGVRVSPWLLLCAFMLALFLALCKRRSELREAGEAAQDHRPALGQYDPRLLDQLIAVVAAATIVCYAIYTLWPETVTKFGTERLGLTIPFVLFGLFRYLDLVYRRGRGGEPEQVLFTDIPTLLNLLGYGAVALWVVLARG